MSVLTGLLLSATQLLCGWLVPRFDLSGVTFSDREIMDDLGVGRE